MTKQKPGAASLASKGITSLSVPRSLGAVISGVLSDRFRSLNSPVKILTHRIGELANLPDPWEHKRSCAAILAKKHQDKNQRLRNIYNAGHKRELNPDEVAFVFAFMEGLKNGSIPAELAGGDCSHGGTLDAPRDGDREGDAEASGGHGGDDQDLAGCLAGSEEGEGDSCL